MDSKAMFARIQMQKKLKVAGFQDLTVLVAEMWILMDIRIQQKIGYLTPRGSQMHSQAILPNGTIQMVMDLEITWNGLTAKLGA
jgi:hypothetical protein